MTWLSCYYGLVSFAPELEHNQLNFLLGINYKYNSKLNHNIDRVWIVTKFKLPNFQDIRMPTFKFDGNCTNLENIIMDPKDRTSNMLCIYEAK